MSTLPAEIQRKCKRCTFELPPGVLSCPHCHGLVHSDELEQLSAAATVYEEQCAFSNAREAWLKALTMLPENSTQAEWVRTKLARLEKSVDAPKPVERGKWIGRLGPLAPIVAVLAKSKALLALFKANFIFSLFAFLWFYWTVFGAKFGIGFAVLILIHEMGHYIDIKRRGLPADMPVFLPGLGAYVRWRALGVSNETRAAVSLAGPLAGWIASAICGLIWWKTGNALWAALARTSAWLNVLNLIPVWVLDGGQAASVLSKAERVLLLTACVVLWLFLGENIFFLVALGALWRLFTKDLPPQASPATTTYFVAVLVSLGIVLRLMPGQGAGLP